jgi:hypothetical protein
MAIATNAMKEALAIEYGSLALYASLHTADPGTTGTNEVTGGSPAYARKSLTWTAGSSDGVVTASATFDVPASTSITHAGIFSASTAGTFYDKVAVTYNSQPSQGQLTVNFTYTQS